MSEQIVDDKSQHCIPFILERLRAHEKESDRPFMLGLNGIQGAGKSTLVSALSQTLRSEPHNLTPAVISIDDFYLRHADQVALAVTHSDNPLVQHRGQPGTHDLPLLISTLSSLRERRPTKVPCFDKSLLSGAGDRIDMAEWIELNRPGSSSVDIVILEGWCIGFQALAPPYLEAKWLDAQIQVEAGKYEGQLGHLKLEDVQFVNQALMEYGVIWKMFDAFIHLDAEETRWVYAWRLQAESRMRREKGTGMTDEQVIRFVDGYYSAYELYTDMLRRGFFQGENRHLRLLMDQDRKVKSVERL